MSRVFIQEADRIRIEVAASANRARRGWLASYALLLVAGMIFLIGFAERMS
jgi:hypothetical protein